MKLYKEHGVNPIGCLGPQLIQMPIFIALYQVIRITLGNSPEGVLYLQTRLYDAALVQNQIPLDRDFLFMNLGDNGNIFLAAIVFAGMWLQQRISSARNQAMQQRQSDQQQQMNQMMQWIMPAMFSWFVIVVPAGLGVYWAASTVIGLVLQWVFVGPGDFTWGSLVPARLRGAVGMAMPAPAALVAAEAGSDETRDFDSDATGEGDGDAGGGSQRKNRRRGRRSGARANRTQPRSGRRRRHPRG